MKPLKKEGVPIEYAGPKEGIFSWLCGLTLPSVGKASYGHSKAFGLANPEEVAALGITDPVKALANSTFFQPVEAEREAKYIKLWEESIAL